MYPGCCLYAEFIVKKTLGRYTNEVTFAATKFRKKSTIAALHQ